MDVDTWFMQFELYLQLLKLDDGDKANLLRIYLAPDIFQTLTTGLGSGTYAQMKKFLVDRYSTKDLYLDHVEFLSCTHAGSAEAFAAAPNRHMDQFAKDMREELLVAKFIHGTPTTMQAELKLRRPATLNDCVKIVNALPTDPNACAATSTRPKRPVPTTSRGQQCQWCGKYDAHHRDSCPARDATCHHCQKTGHFIRMCRRRHGQGGKRMTPGRGSMTVSTTSTNMVSGYLPRSITDKIQRPTVSIKVNESKEINFLVDTGSEISVLNRNLYHKYFRGRQLESLQGATINNFDGSRINFDGWLSSIPVKFRDRSANIDFLVADVPTSVVGIDGITALRLTLAGSSASDTTSGSATSQAQRQSTGTEDLQNLLRNEMVELKKKVDAPATVIQPLRRLPVALEKPVEKEIEKLLAAGTIEAIENSPYVSPIVVVPKKNDTIRLCVDYRLVNDVLITDQYPVPVIDDVILKIRGAKWFSRIDLASAYHQVTLHPDSRDLTAFVTHLGMFRYCKVPFGLASAPAMFNRTLAKVLRGCANTVAYFDDILVFGEDQHGHDKALAEVKRRLHQSGFVVNEDKGVYNVRELDYLGRNISHAGVKPTNMALQGIKEAIPPQDQAQLRSFLGFVSYYRTFIQNLASIAQPLYALTKANKTFTWAFAEQEAYELVKKAVAESVPLAYYDPNPQTSTILTTDASGIGLGAVLSQVQDGEERPVCFISRCLHDQEKKYSASELETLGVIWAVERLHKYLYGRPFEIRTDHIALKSVLMGKVRKDVAPARVVRWATRLLPYHYKVTYVKGKSNVVADGLSRNPSKLNENPTDLEVGLACIQGSQPPCVTYKELQENTAKDETLSQVRQFLLERWPAKVTDNLVPYHRCREDLSINDGLILRGDRIVVPVELRYRLLAFAHEGHFGMVKTKQRLRRSYWWPTMDKEAEDIVRQCTCCVLIPPRDSPVQAVNWPTTPWSHLAMDIAGPKLDAKGKTF